MIPEYWNPYILALIRSSGFPMNTGLSQILHSFKHFFEKVTFSLLLLQRLVLSLSHNICNNKKIFCRISPKMEILSSEGPMKYSLPDQGSEVLALILTSLLSVTDVLTKGSTIWTFTETYWLHSIVQMADSFRKTLHHTFVCRLQIACMEGYREARGWMTVADIELVSEKGRWESDPCPRDPRQLYNKFSSHQQWRIM